MGAVDGGPVAELGQGHTQLFGRRVGVGPLVDT